MAKRGPVGIPADKIMAGIVKGLSQADIGRALGNTPNAIYWRIRNDAELKAAWDAAAPLRAPKNAAANLAIRERSKAERKAVKERLAQEKAARLDAKRAARDAVVGRVCDAFRRGLLLEEAARDAGVSPTAAWTMKRKRPEALAAWNEGEAIRKVARKRQYALGAAKGAAARWGDPATRPARAPQPRTAEEAARRNRLRWVANQRARKAKGLKHGAIGKAVAAPIPQADATLAGQCCDFLKRIYTPAYHRIIHGKEHAGTYQVGGLTLSTDEMIAIAMRKGFGERLAA